MNGYKINRQWADCYTDQVSEILKQNSKNLVMIEIANEIADTTQATDMIVKTTGGRVAVRLRRPQYTFRDLTIRSWLASGAKTELQKIKEGFADWYLYGWTDSENRIADWILVDLAKLRSSHILDHAKEKRNKDGVTGFIAISIGELQVNQCIVAKHIANS